MASSSPAAFGRPRPATEVLFDRICRENGVTHRLTGVRSPTTTGKIERFHQSLRVELLDDHLPFADLAAEQVAIDAWGHHDNTARPHQSLGMATPASRFRPAPADGLPLRLPAGLVPVIEPAAEPARTRLAIGSALLQAGRSTARVVRLHLATCTGVRRRSSSRPPSTVTRAILPVGTRSG